MTPVPFVDLAWQRDQIAETVSAGFDAVLAQTSFVLGPAVTHFEEEFAAYCGVGEVVGVGNGTEALELALRAAGIGPGDEVVIPANTFVATAEAVAHTGASVVLADCNEHFLIDPASVADQITSRTRAVIPVHLYGQCADVATLREIVGPDVILLEDAAQAQGARRDGDRAGSLGDLAATSFYPGKNLGAYGDGGAVLTDSEQWAHLVRSDRDHGGTKKYEHLRVGRNSRLDSLQAVVLSAKLPLLDSWNALRREAASRYDQALANLPGVTVPVVAPGNEHIYHLYVVRCERRDELLVALANAGIGAGIHYPAPVHLLPAFAHLGLGRGRFPRAEADADLLLSLPIYPGITPDQQAEVVSVVRSVMG